MAMSSDASHDRLIGTVSLILDRMVHVRLTAVGITRPDSIDRTPVDPVEFWEHSRVHDPRSIHVNREWESLGGPRWRELELEGESEGPGHHWGSRHLVATAHIRREPGPAPFVLILHGYAVPQTTYDRWLARQMRLRGAHTARLDLPYHLRRTLPHQRSGDGYFSLDPAHIRAVVRQTVEDAAAVIAWARAEVSPYVTVVGVSLGGLIATLLAAELDLDRVIAVAPFCDPATTLSQRPPTPSLRHLGMIGEHSISWGPDRASASEFLQSTLAPIVARNLTPRTPGSRITLVRAMQDLVVGPDPVTRLADTWHTDLWTYPHGHMNVMSASGIARRIADRATRMHDDPDLSVAV
jgi:dienelactone hydrolase